MITFASGGVLPYTKDMFVMKNIKWKKETVRPP